MNYDYSQTDKLISKIPNMRKTFYKIAPISNQTRILSNHFAFIFMFGCGVFFVATLTNINIQGQGNEFVYEYRIKPDFLTGKRFISYRKQSKQFVLY